MQKRILDLLDILRRESGTAVLFVTHDLALAAERADRIMVFRGRDSGTGATETIVQRPAHPYTRQLPTTCWMRRWGWRRLVTGRWPRRPFAWRDRQTLLAGQTGAAGARQRQL